MRCPNNTNKNGFTIVELLVTIAIIGLLSSIVFTNMSFSRKKTRDARRLSDMKQIQTALALYYHNNGNVYPGNTDNDCSGWDAGFNGGSESGDLFIQPLADNNIMKPPGDPLTIGNCGGYSYYRYSAGSSDCDVARGAFFVLGVRDMETSGNPHPSSPGWRCPLRNWQGEFDWVVGGFER